jgi:hypothetical protein
MAAAPVKLLDAYGRPFNQVGNKLYDAARWDRTRPYVQSQAHDYANIAGAGHRTLMTLGRYLYANVAPLQNAVNTIANTAIGNSFIAQFYGADKAWGEKAESLLYEWHKICVLNGGVYDWRAMLQVAIVSIIRDGDIGILLTESEQSGYPQVQIIPAHRIGSPSDEGTVASGPFKGNALVNGAICNEYGRTIGYRVYSADFTSYQEIPASDLALYYKPEFAEQCRGASRIASGIRDWQDRKQAFEFLRLALKKEASYAVVEHTEEGSLDPDADEMQSVAGLNSGTIYEERVDGGAIRVFKSGSNSKVEFPESSRPSANTQAFWERVTRDGLQAIGWPYELTYDSSKIGGASLRMMMEVAQRTIEDYQDMASKIATRIDAWRLAKAIKSGELPANADWWKISHQTPEEMTADKGYSSQVDREEYKLGLTTLKDIAARRGKYWEEEREQQAKEADNLFATAVDLSKRHDIPVSVVLSFLQERNSNPSLVISQATKEVAGVTSGPEEI